MSKFFKLMAAVVMAAALAGCSTMEYQSGGDKGEMHPGHVGHEKH